jgi:formate dehydrogenase iron-sulfur subunit
MNRRRFLKTLGTGIAGAGFGGLLPKAGLKASVREFKTILVDTTRCIGCRRCELACAEGHNLPWLDIKDMSVFKEKRPLSTTQLTVVNRFETAKGEVYVKKQCMHCSQPACVAACLVKAMNKREDGHVTWDKNCMGCRLCMFSCPYDVPKSIVKCDLCWERFQRGEGPACVEACPKEALLYGTRRELLEEARTRIYTKPDRYVHSIYGQDEVGGACWLYLSAVPFEQIGFRTDLGTVALPEHTKGFLYAVPFVLVLWPLFLLGIHSATGKQD